jgi:ATP-dependent exoDNAse (exonuclease V) beta subunit
MRMRSRILADDAYAIRLDKDSDAVEIVTMHACKGLNTPLCSAVPCA